MDTKEQHLKFIGVRVDPIILAKLQLQKVNISKLVRDLLNSYASANNKYNEELFKLEEEKKKKEDKLENIRAEIIFLDHQIGLAKEKIKQEEKKKEEEDNYMQYMEDCGVGLEP